MSEQIRVKCYHCDGSGDDGIEDGCSECSGHGFTLGEPYVEPSKQPAPGWYRVAENGTNGTVRYVDWDGRVVDDDLEFCPRWSAVRGDGRPWYDWATAEPIDYPRPASEPPPVADEQSCAHCMEPENVYRPLFGGVCGDCQDPEPSPPETHPNPLDAERRPVGATFEHWHPGARR